MLSYDDLARRMRVGFRLTAPELASVDAESRARADLGSWLLLRVHMDQDDLASRVLETFGPEHDASIIRGACELGGSKFELWGWVVLARLAEARPSTQDAIEVALASWPALSRPWLRPWFDEAERGVRRPYHRLARNVGMSGETVGAERLRTLLGAFESLRELDLSHATLDDATLRALVAAPELAHLEVLSLSGADIDGARAALIAHEARLPRLEELKLDTDDLTAEGLASITCAAGLPALEHIRANSCGVDLAEFARALDERGGDRQPRPVAFDLSPVVNASEGLIELSHRRAMRWVAGLELHWTEVSPEAARALARAEHATALAHLSINERGLGTDGVLALLEAPWMPGLRSLNLFNQQAGDAIAPGLARLNGGALEALELHHENMGSEAARALGALELPRLRRLQISYNPLGDGDVAAILGNPSFGALELFEAFDCGAGPLTAAAVAKARGLNQLRFLALGGDGPMADETVAAFAQASLPGLRRLQLVGAKAQAVAALAAQPAWARCYVTHERLTSWTSLA